MDLLKLKATLGLDSSEYYSGLHNARREADNFGGSFNNKLGAIGKGFTIFKGAMANLIAGGISAVGSAISGSLDDAISRLDTMNNYSTVMQNLGYSASESETAIKQLADGIDGLPTTLPGIVTTQQQFVALGMSIDDATKFTLALNNATLAGGQGQEAANSAMQQWYQMIANGKSDIQSLRIINAAMPAQLDAIAKSVLGANANWADLHEEWQKNPEITEKVKQAILDLNENGTESMASFAEQAKDATKGIGTSITNIHTAIVKGVANIIDEGLGTDNITDALGRVKDAINAISDEIIDFINNIKEHGLGEAIVTELDKGIEALRERYQTIIDNMDAYIPLFFEKVAEVGIKFSEWMRDRFPELMQLLGELIQHAAEVISEHSDEIVDALAQIMYNLTVYFVENIPKMQRIGAKIAFAIAKGIIKGIFHIPAACLKAVNSTKKSFNKTNWGSVGRNIIKGIAKGIFGGEGSIIRAAVNAAKRAYNAAKKFLGIQSPSKLFRDEIGKNIAYGMALGIEDNESIVSGAMDSVNEQMVKPYESGFVEEYGPEYETESMVRVLNTPTQTQSKNENRNVSVVLQLDRTQLAKTVFKLNDEEFQRVGVSLAEGYA